MAIANYWDWATMVTLQLFSVVIFLVSAFPVTVVFPFFLYFLPFIV